MILEEHKTSATEDMMDINSERAGIIAKVPTEIWAEIFQHAQKTLLVEATSDETRFTQRDVPVSVSQVCDRFRQIALNTPHLWTSIIVDFSSSSSLVVAKLWLERSKNSPLCLLIQNVKGSHLENDPDQRECFHLLLSHLGRWREAAIEWSETNSNFWESMGIVECAPLLESLVLRPTVEEDRLKQGLLPSMLWAGSSRFRKLVVFLWVVREEEEEDEEEFYPPENGYSSWTTSNNIPYQQLTHLHLAPTAHEIVSINEIISIFKGAPDLVCCFIEGITGPEWYNQRPCVPVLLPHLRHLYLAHADPAIVLNLISISDLLRRITAPSLLSLTLVDEEHWGRAAYQDFIARSSCPLEELNLINTVLDLNQLRDCLQSTSSSLRSLHINNLKGTSKEAQNFFATDMAEWDSTTNTFQLCPHLERVSLAPRFSDVVGGKEWYNSKFGPPAFALITQILEARLRPPFSGEKVLKTFLHPSTWTSYVSKSWLEDMREEPWGLKIEFNDDMVNEGVRSARMWERLAYQ